MNNRSTFTNEQIRAAKNNYNRIKAEYQASITRAMFKRPAPTNANVITRLEQAGKLLKNMGVAPNTTSLSGMR
jgi:hypothetical protein